MAATPSASSSDRQQLLSQEVKQLVVEARRLGISLKEVKSLIDAQWKATEKLKAVSNDH